MFHIVFLTSFPFCAREFSKFLSSVRNVTRSVTDATSALKKALSAGKIWGLLVFLKLPIGFERL